MDYREIMKAICLACIVSLALNALNLWPFAWRWATDPTADYIRVLLGNGSWLAIGIWAALVAVITPIIEEVAFRFGVLRALARYTRSPWKGVLGSSLLFGITHLGYWPIWHADVQHLVNASWLFAFSVLLGWLTLRRQGNITLAIAVHSTRNALELGLLIAALPKQLG
jgi:membrane protease YdiL (CAAX protease family)